MQPDRFTSLVRENKNLRIQLREANLTIHSLKQQISSLQERISQYEHEESTWNNIIPDASSDQVFTDSSAESIEEVQSLLYSSERITPNEIPNYSQSRSVSRKPNFPTLNSQSPKIIFNYEQEGNQVPKVLTRTSQKKIHANETPPPSKVRMVQKTSDQDHSAIKIEEPILVRGQNSEIMQRVSHGKKIFQNFFVTGYSFERSSPVINYFYPTPSKHFQAIISLIYNENSLRMIDTISANKTPKHSEIKGKLEVKDTFVIPLCSNIEEERQYLVACEVQDYLEGNDSSAYCFGRMFCFITRCTFFSQINNILLQFVDKLNKVKSPLLRYSPIPALDCKDFLTDQLSEHLRILYHKQVQRNQYANFGLGDQIKIFIDVLPEEREYQYLLQYRQWNVLETPVYPVSPDQTLCSVENSQLLGFLLIYLVSQTKVFLYSTSKSKISQAILHAMQIMKPLEYVNPIIMAAIKDDYQEYLGAPMSVLLGLWGETKKKKQKIEIFMNKRPNLQGMIEEGKLKADDTVIFNLDTGYMFGEGLTPSKNKLAADFNGLVVKECRSVKETYQLFSRLIEGNFMLESPELRKVSQDIFEHLKQTQIYSCYTDRLSNLLSRK